MYVWRSRTPSIHDWRARKLRIAVPEADWERLQKEADKRHHTISRLLSDVAADYAKRLNDKEADHLAAESVKALMRERLPAEAMSE